MIFWRRSLPKRLVGREYLLAYDLTLTVSD